MNLCNQKVCQAVYLQLHKCIQLATLLHVNAMHSLCCLDGCQNVNFVILQVHLTVHYMA